ncbi:alpha-hydroxy acid oxidase [Fodinicola acaciae]|uniref:alpha-hydroxy acid oxidase n=1 Tax=Fodinicola acaciae TaxID=2681555 RepID=UPI001C9E8389|nr:alpha-hydroxy acid oxidase [Fodinicola acaciae]
MSSRRLLTVRDFEAPAREALAPAHYDYFAGGACDEITLAENEAAFRRIALLPRILRGAAQPDLAVELLGCRAATPIMIAPTAFHRIAHPDGEIATARAATAAGAIMIASMASTIAIEEVALRAAETGTPRLWFQLYLQPDLGFTESVVRRAEAAGCNALVLTVDSAVFGRHERDDRNDFHQLPDGLACENLRDADGVVRPIRMSPEFSWRHLEWLRSITDLPVVLKGVLHPDDGRLAVEAGAAAVVVSNHGGRQLDTAPATIQALPAVVRAVDGRIPVLLDGGIRRGTDALKALALGASAVAIGRPVIWGLTVDGEKGVAEVLDILCAELEHAMVLCGYDALTDLGADLLRLPSGE